MPAAKPAIYAYAVHEQRDMPIVTAPVEREWMDQTHQRYAYRCLPLVLANQAGWLILNPIGFSVRWNGGPGLTDLRAWFGRRRRDPRVMSHFGYGVLTFSLPYLFRTPRGINLWVKGPSNWINDGAQPLEGIVETDWSAATFTMNWKLTRPHHAVRFRRGEPICMIVPVPRGLAEGLEARRAPLRSNRSLGARFGEWGRGRSEFIRALVRREPEAVRRGWQRDYFLGVTPRGDRSDGHQTRIVLKEFTRG